LICLKLADHPGFAAALKSGIKNPVSSRFSLVVVVKA
jgi:hypothetical protein